LFACVMYHIHVIYVATDDMQVVYVATDDMQVVYVATSQAAMCHASLGIHPH